MNVTRKKPGLISGVRIKGVSLQLLKPHRDSRGTFTEVFQKHWGTCLQDPVQWSIVHSEAGVFRGMHLHNRHDEYFSLISGRCLVGLKDVREDSQTYEQSALYQLDTTEPCAIIFPKGLLHGWYFTEPSIHLQAVSEAYNDYGADDNWGCRWDDPELGIDWGVSEVNLSDRAAHFPGYEELKRQLKTI
ncbi:MAG: dTDP-4-dehydrorhamnose 3,5-epimerase family protein [Phaeodactylibacter sp.]|uniref:dTDP-4-dehydrorhamnose 3,5-epimerase family protein n=1 Tax=Phaeodactylibacter sp. TaxID=1940289 RepID=UPI0032EDB378